MRKAKQNTAYNGSADDIRDGFIHFSSKNQVAGTADKYFSSEEEVVLLAFDPEAFEKNTLKWEASRGGELFPHLYSCLDVQTAAHTSIIKKTNAGNFDLEPYLGGK